jgi:lipoprotein-anchoring transpeptidase ErfK/SrfK
VAAACAVLLAAALALSACEAGGGPDDARPGGAEAAGSTPEASAPPRPVRLGTNLERPRQVAVDRVVRIRAEHGRLRSLRVSSPAGPLAGELRGDAWVSTGRLEPGTTYRVRAVAERSADGRVARPTTSFRTVDLTLRQQTYASVAPLDGETVGVGMPVVVAFDLPVRNRALFERHMRVRSVPAQRGSWHWVSDRQVRWRPARYWRPGTDVSVEVDVNSLPAGGGVWGQESREVGFHVGDSVVSRIDVDAHVMRTFVNGSLARTMPVSAGKAGWETRSGVKVVMEKHERKRMDAATLGVSEDDPEYYDLANVRYALRVTNSGEFLHAAPWSLGSQGSANVSHGCVGMSTADAEWLYERTTRGDVVEVTGTDRRMTLENGWGDWNLPFDEYAAGSALS